MAIKPLPFKKLIKMNFKRTFILKIASIIFAIICIYILSELSVLPVQWWTSLAVICIAILAIISILILVSGEIHEYQDDNDLLDS